MEYGNVLVIGNSGVGKSTLINAVLGEHTEKKAIAGAGISGTTKRLEIFESEDIPFRIIDTIGFEPSFLKRRAAINAVKKWSKESANEGSENKQVNVIWFCVDGTSRKLFSEAIQNLSKATSFWKSVPVIVVITKSYSEPDREENIRMVHNAFATQKRFSNNLKAVIPVVAETFTINDSAFAAPEGISKLIDVTNEVMPEGLRAAEKDLSSFKLNRKRVLAHSVVGVSTAAGAAAGAVVLPVADAVALSAIETAEINAIQNIYQIPDNADSKKLLEIIIEAGTVSVAAKAALGAIKAIPGINLAGAALNAVVAASFVAALGEGSVYVYEKIYLGEKSLEDIDWVTNFIEEQFDNGFVGKVQNAISELGENSKSNPQAIASAVLPLFNTNTKKGE